MRVPLDGFERARHAGCIELAHAQQARPAKHGVERCPQLVRERGEEILFGAIRHGEVFGATAQIVLEPFALGDVADDEREAAQHPPGVADRGEHHVRLEGHVAAPQPQALGFEPALGRGGNQLRRRRPFVAIWRQVEQREAASDDLVGRVSEQPLAAGVPAGDDPVRTQHADRVIGHAFEQQAKLVLGETQPLALLVELGIEREDAAVGVVELAKGLMERIAGGRMIGSSQCAGLGVVIQLYREGYIRTVEEEGSSASAGSWLPPAARVLPGRPLRKRTPTETSAPAAEGTTVRRWTVGRSDSIERSSDGSPPMRSTSTTWNCTSSDGPSASVTSAWVSGGAMVSSRPTSNSAADSRRVSPGSSANSSPASLARRHIETTSCSPCRTIVASVKPRPEVGKGLRFTFVLSPIPPATVRGPTRYCLNVSEMAKDARVAPSPAVPKPIESVAIGYTAAGDLRIPLQ